MKNTCLKFRVYVNSLEVTIILEATISLQTKDEVELVIFKDPS